MPPEWIALIVVGAIAGVASGMFGIGGGVIIVPALTLLLGYTLTAATGTSLAALLMPVSLFAVINYYQAGKLKLSYSLWIALGLVISARLGAAIALGLDAQLLQQLYGLFLVAMFWRFSEPRKWWAEYRGQSAAPTAPSETNAEARWWMLLVLGLVAGVMAGMFGIGGGLIIVPALVELFSFDQKQAVGTSLGALLPPVSLFAVLAYYEAGQLDLLVALCVAAGLVFGAIAGSKLALSLPSKTIKRLYGVFLLLVGLRFLLF
jgi:uncharacterized membrane protein YfcA